MSLLAAASSFAPLVPIRGALAAPAPPVISGGDWSADHVSYRLETGHVLLRGHARLRLSASHPGATADRYELTARTIEMASGAGAGAATASAVADGNVTIVDLSTLPAANGQPSGRRELKITGQHAVFDGEKQVADITGHPQVFVSDTQLRSALAGDTIHVNLKTREFSADGGTQQVTGTFELAAAPGKPNAAGGSQ